MAEKRAQHESRRNDLTGERAFTDAGQLALLILFFAVWATDVFMFRWTLSARMIVPLAARVPVAALLFASATYLGCASHRIIFGEHRAQPHVVSKGVFGIVRHPMYLAEILFYLGVLLLGLSIAAGVVWLLVIGFLHIAARREEMLLVKRFGDAYLRYMQDVPMWIPGMRRVR